MTRPRSAVDAGPYALLLNHLLADGAKAQDLATRIGFSSTLIRRIAAGKSQWLHPATANAISSLLGPREVSPTT